MTWSLQARINVVRMTRIAHLTDLHLLETGHAARAMREKMRLSFLTLGRAIDAELHRRRFEKALDDAWKARADHLVISGDLTEDGLPEQFEILAEVLSESRWSPDDVTIVPGNHDAYVEVHAFERALAGPLSPWRRTSTPGAITELPNATVIALSTTIDQHWLRAAGRVGEAQLVLLERLLVAQRHRPVAIAMHHPPMPWGLQLRWIEGLLDVDSVAASLARHPHAHVLCGHIHKGGDHYFRGGVEPQIFVANAVVDHPSPLRLYEAVGDRLYAVEETNAVFDPLDALSPLVA